MNVRCKFELISKTEYTKDNFQLSLSPVISGSKENERFYKFTPGGKLEFLTISKSIADNFQFGKQYYIDISEAP